MLDVPRTATATAARTTARSASPGGAGGDDAPAVHHSILYPSAGRAASAARSSLREGSLANPVTVAVLAGDPITGQGAVAYLRTRPEVRILPADRQAEARVVLVVVDTITEDTLKLMERAAAVCAHGDPRFVLVGDGLREHHVLRAITYGLVSVIPRREATFERILRALAEIREGRLEMPGAALGWVADRLHSIQHEVLEPNGLTAAGLEKREVDVLRLLADGLGTPEIAAQLNYSERTVKNIIHGVLTRLKLRNRAHAVAFAVRSGVL